MSRRPPNPNAERTAQNTQTIKSLLKLEGNKICADCKRNKHPRWASWNLGIFVCIRCSGIHRGMGTHISRVKSVDLDSWTDEQLQSVLRWGNARANKYWESKLAPGHVPSEAKIENFIRTKYESKRWVMEGPIPDPSTLDVEGDDDVPLNLVKEKHNLDRSSSQRSVSQPDGPSQIKRAQQPDLFAGDTGARQQSLMGPPTNRVPAKSEAAPPKQTKPADSLLGLDFFGAPPAAQSRPSSTVSAPGGQSRPDLKQSILSLYSTTPKPQSTQQAQQAYGGFVSPQSPPANHSHSTSQSSFGGMQAAFGSLSFSPPAQSQNSNPNAFAALGNISSVKSTPSVVSTPSTGFGGSFFDSKPANKPAPTQAPQLNRTATSSSGFGAFSSSTGSPPMSQNKASSGLEDLFDFGAPSMISAPPKQTLASPPATNTSVFNLSQPSPQLAPQPLAASSIGWGNNADAWGSNDAWSTPDPVTSQSPPTMNKPLPPMQTQASSNDFGWGSSTSPNSLANQSIIPSGGGGFNRVASPPKVSVDEDFGGWSSAVPVTPAATSAAPAPAKTGGGFGASEDLFSNVWE